MKDEELVVTLSEKNKRLEDDIEELRLQLKKEKNKDFVDELVRDLYILPSQRKLAEDVISLAETLDDSGIITLSEGEPGLKSKIKTLLKSKKIIELSMQTQQEKTKQHLDEMEEERRKQKEYGDTLDRDITFYMKKHGVSYKHAFLAVTKSIRGVL
ncbi:hypothetical protein EGB40_03750 [Pasteurella multocida]|uniref:hypothetical protein n=1 Tax=Pasteurella multocida TaxID=747 RepID=UPI00135A629B|nr:hypothetical protein [Pasteurella multocida]NAT88463.1 hypothetical protein [Pasteurella multocida]